MLGESDSFKPNRLIKPSTKTAQIYCTSEKKQLLLIFLQRLFCFRVTFSIAMQRHRLAQEIICLCVFVSTRTKSYVELLIHILWNTITFAYIQRFVSFSSYQPKYNLHMVDYITHVVGKLKYDRLEFTKQSKLIKLIYSSKFRLAFGRWCRPFWLCKYCSWLLPRQLLSRSVSRERSTKN